MAEIDTKPAADAFDGTERFPVKQAGYKKGTLAQVLTYIRSAIGFPTFDDAEEGQVLTIVGGDPEWAEPPAGGGGDSKARIAVMAVATPEDGEVLTLFVAPADMTFPANFAGSRGKIGNGGANPAASFVATVWDDATQIGTIAVSTSGVFTFATSSGSTKAIAAGHCVIVKGPATADTAIQNFAATLVADFD